MKREGEKERKSRIWSNWQLTFQTLPTHRHVLFGLCLFRKVHIKSESPDSFIKNRRSGNIVPTFSCGKIDWCPVKAAPFRQFVFSLILLFTHLLAACLLTQPSTWWAVMEDTWRKVTSRLVTTALECLPEELIFSSMFPLLCPQRTGQPQTGSNHRLVFSYKSFFKTLRLIATHINWCTRGDNNAFYL